MSSHWKRLASRQLGDYRIFKLSQEGFESPRNAHRLDAVILEAADWVNVVALTPNHDCVMVRQYRFGTAELTLEIPGGVVDAGELPLTAAQRELREETGYTAQRWTSLGSIAPNPAFLRNRLHSFLAEGCVRVGEQVQDHGEDIEVVLLAASQVDASVARGELDHALVLVAFHKLALLRRGFEVT